MTIEEARQVIHRLNRPRDRNDDNAWDREFGEASASTQASVREAMGLWLEEGTDLEQRSACGFYGLYGMDPDEAVRLAALYVERGWDSAHDAALPLAHRGAKLDEASRGALLRLFLADTQRHLSIAGALDLTPGSAAWSALAALVARTGDVELLAVAYNAAYSAGRRDDFYALLRGKAEAVIRALSRRVGGGDELLAACGLPPLVWLTREEVTARLAARRAVLVEPAWWGADREHRFALYLDGGQVKRVDYDPAADRVRRLECSPAGTLAERVQRHTAERTRDDSLAPMKVLDRRFQKAVERREKGERELRRVLADGACWVADSMPGTGVGGFMRHDARLGWHRVAVAGGTVATLQPVPAMEWAFDGLLYTSPERAAEPVPPEVRRRLDAIGHAYADTWQRLRAGAIHLRWDSPHARTVGLREDGLWILGEHRLSEIEEARLCESLLTSALRGELEARIVPLPAAGTR